MRKSKPKLQPKATGGYILGMHLDDTQIFFLRRSARYDSITAAMDAAKEKHAKYGKCFSIYRLVATTHIEPSAVQLELFK